MYRVRRAVMVFLVARDAFTNQGSSIALINFGGTTKVWYQLARKRKYNRPISIL